MRVVRWFLVQYTVVPTVVMALYLALTLLSGFVMFMGGYSIQTNRFMHMPDPRTSMELTCQPNDPGKGFTAVVYFTHGEPETYDPIGWINQFRVFDEAMATLPRAAR